jgi:hypothetical protein
MPYVIRNDGPANKPYCVYKESGGEALGCHASQGQAERHLTAILVSTHSTQKSSEASTANQPLRMGVIVTSNAYQDRDREIIRQKALEDWVAAAWKENTFVASNPLLFWHCGDPIGDIIYADTEGPFLIEVAKERPNAQVNLMPPGEPVVMASIKSVWNALETLPIDWGASHEFLYLKEDSQDNVYERIVKTESSVLPRRSAANLYTLFNVIKEKHDG